MRTQEHQKALAFLKGHADKRLELFYEAIKGKIRATDGHQSSTNTICGTPTRCQALCQAAELQDKGNFPNTQSFSETNWLPYEDSESMVSEDIKAKVGSYILVLG